MAFELHHHAKEFNSLHPPTTHAISQHAWDFNGGKIQLGIWDLNVVSVHLVAMFFVGSMHSERCIFSPLVAL
jgi:hypothetical protein